MIVGTTKAMNPPMTMTAVSVMIVTARPRLMPLRSNHAIVGWKPIARIIDTPIKMRTCRRITIAFASAIRTMTPTATFSQ